jgi:hypothetical protein
MMRRRYIAAILGILAVAVLTVRAEDFWVKKDWTKWSKDECNKMLTDSPWSKKWGKGEVLLSAALPSQTSTNPANMGRSGAGGPGGSGTGTVGAGQEGAAGDSQLELHYFIELKSALPIREAMARQAQLVNNYDKMDAEHKKAFDSEIQGLLDAKFDDVIDVHVTYGSTQQYLERQLATYWKAIPADALPVDVFLVNEHNERVLPVKFISPKTADYSFDLIFPRMKDNEPVIRAADKSFSIQFPHPAVGSQNHGPSSPGDPNNPNNASNPSAPSMGKERVLITYKLDKMVVNGKATF